MTRAELTALGAGLATRRQTMELRLLVCCGTPCLAAGAEAVADSLRERLATAGQAAELEVVRTGCLGPCSRGPLLTVQRPGAADLVYEQVTPLHAVEILEAHLNKTGLPEQNRLPDSFSFLSRQTRVVLANCGRIDPEDIQHYLGYGGYAALARVLHEMSPDEVCEWVAVAAIPPASSGSRSARSVGHANSWWPTATRVIPGPTWTVP
jgi:bidirectional [NiFe] hydrogenase diaphorase subunit